MPLVALNWDPRRILVAIARRSAGRVVFDRALTVELMRTEDESLDAKRLGGKIKAVLQANGVSRGEATVVVSRGSIEMRQFEVPPVPDEELPELVRFQARNHFNALGDDWTLDFVPIHTSNGQLTSILAAAISPKTLAEIRKTVESAGLRLRHVVIRPFAAVELMRSVSGTDSCQITVELSGRQANLSVVDNGHLLFTRTVRVPESYSDDQFDNWLPGEVQRTIAAARNQAEAPEINKIIVFGKASEHERLRQGLQESFVIETEFFNPFDAVSLSREFKYPDRFDGFASLLGAIVQQSATETRSIDFINPRRPETSHETRNMLTIAGAIAASLFIVGMLIGWWVLRSRDAEIADLQSEITTLKQQAVTTDDIINRVAFVDDWKSRDIQWLDELYELSDRLLTPDESIVDSFVGNLYGQNAIIELAGKVKDSQSHNELSDNLASRPYEIIPRSSNINNSGTLRNEFKKSLRMDLFDIAAIDFDSQLELPGSQDSDDGDTGDSSIDKAESVEPKSETATEASPATTQPRTRELPK